MKTFITFLHATAVVILTVSMTASLPGQSLSPAGYALSFDGSSSYVDLGNSSVFDLTSGFTVEAWVKVALFTHDWQAVVTKGDNTWRLHRSFNTNVIGFGTTNTLNQSDDLTGKTNVNDGNWHHIAAVYDGTHKYLYVDGLLDSSSTPSGTLNTSTNNVYIGENSQQTGRQFDGTIDEVRIWNVARTQSQIQQSMNSPLTGVQSGLVAYYRFDEGSGSTAGDSSGNGHNGTLVNNPAWVASTAPIGISIVSNDITFLSQSTAVLTSTVEPDGDSSTVFIEYGIDTSYGSVGTSHTTNNGTADVVILDSLSGLNSGTLYHYRTVASNAGGSVTGPDHTFTTVGTIYAPAGDALYFDGDQEYVNLGNSSSFNLSGGFTVEAWFMFDSLSANWEALVTKGDGTWRIHRYGTTNVLAFSTNNGAPDDLAGITPINDHQWHHVAAVFAGSTKYLYVDGNLDATSTVGGSLNTSSDPVYIGENSADMTRGFQGAIDEVRIWSIPLTQTQIQKTMNQTLAGTESGLVAYYKFDEAGGTFVGDSSGHGNLGILVNTPIWISSGAQIGTGKPVIAASGVVSVSTTSAVVSTTVNPNARFTTVQFAYGPTSTYGLIGPIHSIGSGSTAVVVTDTITGLSSGTACHFRPSATNSFGTSNVSDADFVTAVVSSTPSFESQKDSVVDPSSELVTVYVRPNGSQTRVGMSYGLTSGYGISTTTDTVDAPGSSLTFDGSTNYVYVAGDTALDLVNGTIEFWMQPNWQAGTIYYNPVVVANRDTSTRFTISIDYDLSYIQFSNGTKDWQASYSFSTGTWYHVALVVKNFIATMYVNGESIGTQPEGFGSTSRQPVTIGSTLDTHAYFPGSIDEVRIWNTPLDASTINSWMRRSVQPSHPFYTHLVAGWKFDERAGTTVSDASGNGRTGTVVNSAVWTSERTIPATFTLTGLSGGTVYHDRGSATNASGTTQTADTTFLTLSPGSGGSLYISDQSSSIQTMSLSGGNTANLLGGLSIPADIVVDNTSNRLYWIETGGSNNINSSNLDGSDEATVYSAGNSSSVLAFDDINYKVYWGGGTSLYRSNPDGSNEEPIANPSFLSFGAIAVDGINHWVYATSYYGNFVGRMSFDGTVIDTLARGNYYPNGIAVDVAHGKVYFLSTSPAAIVRVDTDGTNLDTVLVIQSGNFGSQPQRIALDLNAGEMYWTDSYDHSISRANLDGTNVWKMAANLPYSPFGLGVSITQPLPVELASLTAQSEGLKAVLKWTTATETNNAGFAVERASISATGAGSPGTSGEAGMTNVHWSRVGFIRGAGSSAASHSYEFTDANVPAGHYAYRLRQIDRSGAMKISQNVEVEVGTAPKTFQLMQNYPNPFNPSTNIQFTLPRDGRATLKVYDVTGREVATLFEGPARAGTILLATFDGTRLASGVYFARLAYSGQQLVKKMLLIK